MGTHSEDASGKPHDYPQIKGLEFGLVALVSTGEAWKNDLLDKKFAKRTAWRLLYRYKR